MSWRQWRNKEYICPRAQHFGDVNWDWNVTQQLRHVQCQWKLIITIYKMSNATRWYPLAKSHLDQRSSQKKQLRTLVTFQGVACVSGNQRPHVVWLAAIVVTGVSLRHTIFLWLKTGTLQNNEAYQINVVDVLLGVCSYFRFL